MRVIFFSLVVMIGATFLRSQAFAKQSNAPMAYYKIANDSTVPITPMLECSDDPVAVMSQLSQRPVLNKPEDEIQASHHGSLRYLNFLLRSDRLDAPSDELIAKAIVYIQGGGLTIIADALCDRSVFLKLSNGRVLYLPLRRE